MTPTVRRFVTWSPRVLTMAMAAFLAMFAMDVFDLHAGLLTTVAGLFYHLLPTWLVLLALAAAWRHEWVGGVLFPLLALVHVGLSRGRLDPAAYVAIDLPLLVVGALFWLSWVKRRELRAHAW